MINRTQDQKLTSDANQGRMFNTEGRGGQINIFILIIKSTSFPILRTKFYLYDKFRFIEKNQLI